MAQFDPRESRRVNSRPESFSRHRSMSTTAVVGCVNEPRPENRRRDGRTQEDRQQRGQSLNINLAPIRGDATRLRGHPEQEERFSMTIRDLEDFFRREFAKLPIPQFSPSVSARGGGYSDEDTDYLDDSHVEDYRESQPSSQHGQSYSAPSHRSPGPESGTYLNSSQSAHGPSTPPDVRDEGSRRLSPDRARYKDMSAQTEPSDYERRDAKSDSHRRSRVLHSNPTTQEPVAATHSSRDQQSRNNSGSNSPSPRSERYSVIVELGDNYNHRHSDDGIHVHRGDRLNGKERERGHDIQRQVEREREHETRKHRHQESRHRPRTEYVYESNDGVRDRRDDYIKYGDRRRSSRREDGFSRRWGLCLGKDRRSKYD